jgi:alpha-glucosidase
VAPERMVDVAGRDPERTPMQWRPGPGAGFTTGESWLPIGDETRRGLTVEDQRDDPASMLSFTRRAIWFRRSSPALRWGSYREVELEPGVFAYVREAQAERERLLVVLEFEGRRRTLDLAAAGLLGDGRSASVVLSTRPDRELGSIDSEPLELGPDEGLIARLP